MTTDNEALKLANSVPELQSLLYDVDLMPEQPASEPDTSESREAEIDKERHHGY